LGWSAVRLAAGHCQVEGGAVPASLLRRRRRSRAALRGLGLGACLHSYPGVVLPPPAPPPSPEARTRQSCIHNEDPVINSHPPPGRAVAKRCCGRRCEPVLESCGGVGAAGRRDLCRAGGPPLLAGSELPASSTFRAQPTRTPHPHGADLRRRWGYVAVSAGVERTSTMDRMGCPSFRVVEGRSGPGLT
jgi:hypothetical protein